jgi:hypothetical protein
VTDQIEYVDHLIALDRKERGRIANPAGLYVWAIQEDLSVPADFDTSVRRQKKEVLQQAEEDERARRCRLELDYEEFCRREVRRKIDAEFAGERLNVAIREHMRVLKREQPDWFQRVPEATRREVALSRLETKVRESIALPTVEQWAKQNTQRSMF